MGLGDGANSSRNGNGDSGGRNRAGWAAHNGRSTARDGVNRSSKNSRSPQVNGGYDGRTRSRDAGARGGTRQARGRACNRFRCRRRLSRICRLSMRWCADLRSAGGRTAREGHAVDSNAAGRLGLVGLRWVDDGHVASATALGVLDGGTLLGTGRALLAVGAIGHVIVKLQVAVELGLNVNLAQ